MGIDLNRVQLVSPAPRGGMSGAPASYVNSGIKPAQTGNLVGAITDIAAVFADADRENRFSEYKADTTKRLAELYIGLESETDPMAVRQKWDAGVADLATEYKERLGEGSALYSTWSNHFSDMTTRYGIDVSQRQRGLIVDQGRAALLAELDAESVALKAATRPEDYDSIKQRGIQAIERKKATGIISAEDAEQRSISWESNVDKLAEEQERERKMQSTYAFLRNGFSSPSAAVDFLEDPRNQQSLGLSLKESLYFIDIIDAEGRRDREQQSAAVAAAQQKEANSVYNALLGGDYAGAMGALANSAHIPDETRLRLQDAIRSREWKDDPAVVAELRRSIWAGEMTDAAAVVQHLGQGVSVETAKSLRDDIERLGDQRKKGDGLNYFDMAVARFRKRFSDRPDVLEQEAKFVASMSHMARERDLSPYDPQLDKIADELLAPFDNGDSWYNPLSWFGEDVTNFEQILDSGKMPYDAAPGQGEYRRRIPPQAYELIKNQLAQAGKDTSDATIYQVYVANRQAFEGAK